MSYIYIENNSSSFYDYTVMKEYFRYADLFKKQIQLQFTYSHQLQLVESAILTTTD